VTLVDAWLAAGCGALFGLVQAALLLAYRNALASEKAYRRALSELAGHPVNLRMFLWHSPNRHTIELETRTPKRKK
jgi:short subunit fatty acids transporter